MRVHRISVQSDWNPVDGWSWTVYTYRDDELNDMLAFLRGLDAQFIRYVHSIEEE